MKIKLITFDLDGTLVDAYPAIIKSFNFTMKKIGCPTRSNRVIRRAVGWGDENLLLPFIRLRSSELRRMSPMKSKGGPAEAKRRRVIQRTTAVKPWGSIEKKDLKKALTIYRRHHAKALTQYARLLACTCGVLRDLKKRGFKLAIASNRPTRFSKILMNALKIDKCFDYVLCADKLKEGKPNPEILNRILKHFKLKKNQMFYVGDMTVDAQAGRRAGVKTIIVLGGSSSKQEIQREKPFKIIRNICDLIKIVENHN